MSSSDPSSKASQVPSPPPPGAHDLEALVAQARSLFQQGQWAAAQACLPQERLREQRHVLGTHMLALICAQSGREAQAGALWKAMLDWPGAPPLVLPNYGRLLQLGGQLSEAIALLQRAVALRPNDYVSQLNLGVALLQDRQHAAAREHLERAAALQPGAAQPLFNLGRLWEDQYQYEQAHACYREALRLEPAHGGAIRNLIFTQHYLEKIDPLVLRQLAGELGERMCAKWPRLAQPPTAAKGAPWPARKLRLGLLSADLRLHPVGWFLLNVLPHMDAARFELVAFSNSAVMDALSQRLQACCSGWHRIDALGDREAAVLIAEQGIDLLLDLSGLTAGNRLEVLAQQPAPVQLSWLGYFGTTGLPTVQYLLADPVCVPPDEAHFYTEKVWHLPHSRFCMAVPEDAPPVNALPALRRPEAGLTLASFQELAKINERTLRVWAQLLAALPQARLRLQHAKLGQAQEVQRLRARLVAHGVDVQRVSLYPGTDRASYLAAHHEVDFILDTFPYPGGTTTAEALWMGVPTLTLAEPGMLSRQGQAHLHNVGLAPGWVTFDEAQYVERARYWSAALAELAQIRQQLRSRCRASRLFNGSLFAADLMDALSQMGQRHLL